MDIKNEIFSKTLVVGARKRLTKAKLKIQINRNLKYRNNCHLHTNTSMYLSVQQFYHKMSFLFQCGGVHYTFFLNVHVIFRFSNNFPVILTQSAPICIWLSDGVLKHGYAREIGQETE